LRNYEGLFLVDDKKLSDNYQNIADHIRGVLERHGAKVQSLEKWDTRRLATEIDGKRRGAYLLSYFEADPEQIDPIKRDYQISNLVLRTMILREELVGSPLPHPDDRGRRERDREKAKPDADKKAEGGAKTDEAKPDKHEKPDKPAKPEGEEKPAGQPVEKEEEQEPSAEPADDTSPNEETGPDEPDSN
jgi:small subunit ribosomal protein S6